MSETAMPPKPASKTNGDRRNASLKWDNTRKGSNVAPTGRRPLPEPMTIANTILMVILHVCRKAVLIDAKYKVGIYLGFLFVGSTISDIGFPIPRTYLANKNNIFNLYFVKLGWGWTFTLTSLYIYLSTSVYCAGDKRRTMHHLLRMVVGTAVWFLVTNFFVFIEARTGSCSSSKITSRVNCLNRGHRWIGFDISGHCFLLIYCHLLIAEELRTLFNWERIADIIRNEQFDDDSPMKNLTEEQKQSLRELYPRYLLRDANQTYLIDDLERISSIIYIYIYIHISDTFPYTKPNYIDQKQTYYDNNNKIIKDNAKFLYRRYTPYIRALFLALTALAVLWDVMLVGTVLYFHTMVQKVAGGIFAVLCWYFTYRFWYPSGILPPTPGVGLIRYTEGYRRA